jgi:hypothetical protein
LGQACHVSASSPLSSLASSHHVDLQVKPLGKMALAFGQMPTETQTGKVFTDSLILPIMLPL